MGNYFLFVQGNQSIFEFLTIVKNAVSIGFVGVEHVSVHPIDVSAELGEEDGLHGRLQLYRLEIYMLAFHVACGAVEPAGGGVDKAGGVHLFQTVVHVFAVKLSPSFVEDGPAANRGMIPQLRDGFLHGAHKCLPRGGIPMEIPIGQLLQSYGGQSRIPEERIISVVHHVLEDDHAQPVAGVVEIRRLDLDMLAQHIESQILHGQDIVVVAFGRGGREDAVAEISLIQHAVEEIRLSVQAKAGDAVYFANI